MRSLAIQAAVLALALCGAYLTWTAEPERPGAAGLITVLDAEPEDLQEVRYSAEKMQVRLTQRTDDAGEYLWVQVDRTTERAAPPEPKAPPSGGTGGTGEAAGGSGGAGDQADANPARGDDAPKMIVEEHHEAFKGNAAADKLLAALAPFQAKRRLGEPGESAADLAELGLDTPAATLTVVTGSGEHSYALGDTVFGGDSRYVQDTDSGALYLVDARVLQPLASAHSSLVDRALFPGGAQELLSVRARGAAGEVTLTHENRADRQAAYWAVQGGEGASEPAQAWIRKLQRVRVRAYLSTSPQELELNLGAPQLTLDVTTDAPKPGTVTHVEIYKGPQNPERPADAPHGAAAPTEAWYARSDHDRAWVELYATQASDLVQDLDTLTAP